MSLSPGAKRLICIVSIVLAVVAGIIAIGTQEWQTLTINGQRISSSGIFGANVLDGRFNFSFDDLSTCEGRVCNGLRATAAGVILAILLGAIAALVVLIGICTEKTASSPAARVLLGLAFVFNVVALIVYPTTVFEDLNIGLPGIVEANNSLGYSWGLVIPAALLDAIAGAFVQ